MSKKLEHVSIKWHQGFYGATELEFIANKHELAFFREYQLNKEPLRMDLMIIRKITDVPLENEIGHLFRKHNVVEYKSPNDTLTIDDFYKALTYAGAYKSSAGHTVNEIPASEVTVSLVHEKYPKELFRSLKQEGKTILEKYPGIYYVQGKITYDAQIIVTKQLTAKSHHGLRVLSNHALESDIRGFLRDFSHLEMPDDKQNLDAVLEVSVSANEMMYELVRRDSIMCDALRRLMKDEIDVQIAEAEARAAKAEANAAKAEANAAKAEANAAKAEANAAKAEQKVANAEQKVAKAEANAAKAEQKVANAKAEGKTEGKTETLLESVKNVMRNMKLSADEAMDILNIPSAERSKYMAKL